MRVEEEPWTGVRKWYWCGVARVNGGGTPVKVL